MDRYVIREQRSGAEYPEGNQMIAFSAPSTGNNITIPENIYYAGYSGKVQNLNIPPHIQAYSSNVIQAQGQIVSGIDPRYMTAYADGNASYIATGQPTNSGQSLAVNTFGNNYQNRNFIGAEPTNRNFKMTESNRNIKETDGNNRNFAAESINHNLNRANNLNFNRAEFNNRNFNKGDAINRNFNEANAINRNFNAAEIAIGPNNSNFNTTDTRNRNFNTTEVNNRHATAIEKSDNKFFAPQWTPKVQKQAPIRSWQTPATKNTFENEQKNNISVSTPKKTTEIDLSKHEVKNQVKTRAEKLKELHKTGARVFSGPVEKILKWHKSIQDIGIMVFYEIVGKCVNVRAGESCAKNLVVRDENGPAIQVVYYEIDFFLPELKPPCTVRVVGRMLPGTNRLQAFNVRPATGDDVATLPRRAAVAAHHVAKLCKEYGIEVLTLK